MAGRDCEERDIYINEDTEEGDSGWRQSLHHHVLLPLRSTEVTHRKAKSPPQQLHYTGDYRVEG